MQVTVKVLGVAAVPPLEMSVEFDGRTLTDLRNRLGEAWNEVTTMDGLLLAFLNGEAVRSDWEDTPLKPGDRVLFALPVVGQ